MTLIRKRQCKACPWKVSTAPARDLYQGELFKLSTRWITLPNRVDAWAILSAKHGVVLPDQVIEPYDVSLLTFTEEERRAWCELVRRQLEERWGREAIYTVLAGDAYRAAVRPMPYYQGVIECWTKWRRETGMRRPQMGIGVIKKALREMRGFY